MITGRSRARFDLKRQDCVYDGGRESTQVGKANWLSSQKQNRTLSGDTEPKKIRAAEYVRMSTEHQKYSTENQGDAIRVYAEHHHMEIVRTYSDAGKSGLKIEGRGALRQLIDDVEGGTTDFDVILGLRHQPMGPVPRRR